MARWIKVSTDIFTKPAIRAIKRDCGCSIEEAIVAWLRLYMWFDEQTADGIICADRELVDAEAHLEGIARSLEHSGWLTFNDDFCIISNWGEHNGQSAKYRAQNAKAMTAIREAKRDKGIPLKPCPRPHV